jgi:hypothetical protein
MAAFLTAEGDCYIYDRWGQIEHSPDAYHVEKVYVSDDIGAGKLLVNPQGLFCRGSDVYICDTGNNRIIELTYNSNRTLVLKRVIDHFFSNGAVTETFASPNDVYVAENGTLYVADTDNGRVVKLDKDLNYLLQFTMPLDPTYDQSLAFMPMKVIADVSGRVYVIAKNVNKGFVKYESDGTFTNFWGASEVHPKWSDIVWKRLSTRKQREQMESFVPTEFSNVYEDNEGFLYAVLKTFNQWDIQDAKPIRRLNALGSDILIKNAKNLPIGDLSWATAMGSGYDGPSRFEDITVLDNDVYLALDGTRGRIFGYNNQGYLLFAFGGRGNNAGYFKGPIAIDHIGRDLLVLDTSECSITVFSPTYYGSLIYDALEQYANGEYEASATIWQNILLLNGNYDLAYVGLGKAELRQNHYKKAMDYFSVKKNSKEYSKAFVLYRKEWFEKNIGWIFGIIVIIAVVWLIVKRVKKIREEVASL